MNNIQRRPALNQLARTATYPANSSIIHSNDRRNIVNDHSPSNLQTGNSNVNGRSNISFRITDMGVVRTFNDMLTALSSQGIQFRMVQSQVPEQITTQSNDPNVLLLNEQIDFSDVI